MIDKWKVEGIAVEKHTGLLVAFFLKIRICAAIFKILLSVVKTNL
jgi:hypothetical protein